MMKNDNSVSDLIDKDWARGSGEETSSLTRGHQYHRSIWSLSRIYINPCRPPVGLKAVEIDFHLLTLF